MYRQRCRQKWDRYFEM